MLPRALALFLLLSPHLSAQTVCGDCDGNGIGTTVLDALEAARLAVRIPPAATDAQDGYCDVDLSFTIDVIDSLRIAQVAAGLTNPLQCPAETPTCGLPAPLPNVIWALSPVPMQVTLLDPNVDPVTASFDWSTNSGRTWTSALAAPSSPASNPITTVPTQTRFDWDVAPLATPQLSTAELRCTITDGVTTSTCSRFSELFTADPLFPDPWSSVVFVIDRSASTSFTASDYPLSTGGTGMAFDAIRDYVKRQIATLSPTDTFSVIAIHHSYLQWMPNLANATPANVAAAHTWIDALSPSGGCVFTPGVIQADMLGPTQIILVSASVPAEGYAAVSSITSSVPAPTRIETVSFAQGFGSTGLLILHDLASQNRGLCTRYP